MMIKLLSKELIFESPQGRQIECPYCEHKQDAPDEIGRDDIDDVECEGCGKMFYCHCEWSPYFSCQSCGKEEKRTEHPVEGSRE